MATIFNGRENGRFRNMQEKSDEKKTKNSLARHSDPNLLAANLAVDSISECIIVNTAID